MSWAENKTTLKEGENFLEWHCKFLIKLFFEEPRLLIFLTLSNFFDVKYVFPIEVSLSNYRKQYKFKKTSMKI
jgi:hypothetical protein